MAGSANYLGLPAGFANDSPFPPLRSPTPSQQQQKQRNGSGGSHFSVQSTPSMAHGPAMGGPSSRPQHLPFDSRPQHPQYRVGMPPPQQLPPQPQHYVNGTQSPYTSSYNPGLRHEQQQQQQPLYRPAYPPAGFNGAPYPNTAGMPAPRPGPPAQHRLPPVHGPPVHQRVASPVIHHSAPVHHPHASGPMHAPHGAPRAHPMPMPIPMPAPYGSPVPSTFGRSPPGPVPNGFVGSASPPLAQPRHSTSSLRSDTSVQTLGTAVEGMWPFTKGQNGDSRGRRLSDHSTRSVGTPSQREQAAKSTDLRISLPELVDLTRMREDAFASKDDRKLLKWCKEVVRFVERKHDSRTISEPVLVGHIDQAIQTIGRLASANNPNAEALYLRGDLLASGAFPSYHEKNPKAAFSDFELSARIGHAASWFRVGRDYELLGDLQHARDAYERGCSVQDVGCIYRMGMANLLGQLELTVDYDMAMPLLKEAADLSNIDAPQPSHVYGMLLIGEFSQIKIPKHLLNPTPDPQKPDALATIEGEARRRIQRSAFLNLPQAQYRCGLHHEYAMLECPFDPLLSVQYYSLASQGGETEADLALSKWFLCGAEGCFDKNEKLAFTFAEKAAKKGLHSAEFAMGYYNEVGVGCQQDTSAARDWYLRAASHGNTDAKERLDALKGSTANLFSRTQHEQNVNSQLQRKRTEAKMISDRRHKKPQSSLQTPSTHSNVAASSAAPSSLIASLDGQQPTGMPRQSAELRRNATMCMVEELAYPASRRSSAPSVETIQEHGGSSSSERVRPDGLPIPATNTPPFMPAPRVPSNKYPQQPSSSSRISTPSRISNETARTGLPNGQTQSSGPVISPAAPPSKVNSSSATARPPSSIVVDAYGGTPGSSNASSLRPSKHVYETFSEMGIKPARASQDRDCIIM